VWRPDLRIGDPPGAGLKIRACRARREPQDSTHGLFGCLLALLALISPRLVLFLLWIFSDVLSRAFDSWILPLLGFFLLPWTTLTYAASWDWGSGREVTGFEWFFVVLAFLNDLGAFASGRRVQYARAEG
jgi:hypothetical protein